MTWNQIKRSNLRNIDQKLKNIRNKKSNKNSEYLPHGEAKILKSILNKEDLIIQYNDLSEKLIAKQN